MSTETLMFVERLTAPKPNWSFALLAMKGVQPVPIGVEYAKCRRSGDFLIITIIGIDSPESKDHMCDLETHCHIDEIVHVDFYSNTRLKPKPKAEKPDLIMPTNDEINTAKTGKLSRV